MPLKIVTQSQFNQWMFAAVWGFTVLSIEINII